MKLEALELHRIRLPLVAPFRTSFGEATERDALLVRAVGPDSDGWGECVAMHVPMYSSEYTEAAVGVTRDVLGPALLAAGEVDSTGVAQRLGWVRGHRMAKAAVEAAVLDAELRATGVSFASHLGAVRDRVPAGVSVGIMRDIPELLQVVDEFLEQGYLRIKLKIKPGWDVEPVRAVRAEFGDGVVLQVDANAAYSLADAQHLARLDEFGLVLLEQPLEEDDLAGHAALAQRIRTPICLDESVVSARSAAHAIALGACSIVNVKPGRVGGYLEARRIHDVCAANGVPVWCGGMMETGIGRAANVALAALPNFTLPGDTSASDRYYREDITEPFVLQDGHVDVPQGPGLGVTVDPDRLATLRTSLVEVR